MASLEWEGKARRERGIYKPLRQFAPAAAAAGNLEMVHQRDEHGLLHVAIYIFSKASRTSLKLAMDILFPRQLHAA